MRKTLKEIAGFISGELIGDGQIVITGVNGIKDALPGDITFLANPKYAPLINSTSASAIITSKDIVDCKKPIIRTDNPSLAFSKVISLVSPDTDFHPSPGVHPSAVMGKGVKLGEGVFIGAYVVIDDNVKIGKNSVIYPGTFIGRDSAIGDEALIYPNVSIRERTVIGRKVIIHSGTVIGSDGFGFVTVDGAHHKIPQVGSVEIGDNVEIGANVTIDRARFDKTIIGSGTKIDNLVQIAHNVVIGKNCLIVAQVGISGSTVIEDGVILAGQVGVVGHITVGKGAVVTAQSGVSKSIEPGTISSGSPAQPVESFRKVNACIQNLPRFVDTIRALKKKIEELENLIKKAK